MVRQALAESNLYRQYEITMIHIRYNDGRVLQGIVLAFGDRLVRVAVQDSDDAVEYRMFNRVWVSEDCEVVVLDFADAVPVESTENELLESMFRIDPPARSIQRVM